MSATPSRPAAPRSQSFVNWGHDAVHKFDTDAPAASHYESELEPTEASAAPTPATTDYDPVRDPVPERGSFPFPPTPGAFPPPPPPAQRRVPRVSQMPAFPPPTYTRPNVHRSSSADSAYSSPPPKPKPAPQPPKPQPKRPTPQARSYSQVEDGGRSGTLHPGGTGILSSLLHLNALRRRDSSTPSAPSTAAPSRATSSVYGQLPTYDSLGMRRTSSVASVATLGDNEGLDEEHPEITGKRARRDWFAQHESEIREELKEKEDDLGSGEARKLERKAIQYHMSSVKAREAFMLKLAKALLSFGFPPHRLEPALDAVASYLYLDATTTLLTKRIQIVFEDRGTGTSITKVIKAAPSLALGKLHDTHQVYRAVMHDDIGVDEGTRRLNAILKAPEPLGMWGKVALVWLCGIFICPAFGGSVLDSLVASVPGAFIFLLQQWIAAKNSNLRSISNIIAAILGSFYARGLSQTGLFCYEAIASASIVFILPAFPALCGALELLNENWDRAVASIGYAVLYVVVLGMGLSIGSNFYFDIAGWAGQATAPVEAAAITLAGTFNAVNGTSPLTGTFTFSNDTSNSLDQGNVSCYRDPAWPWYRQSISSWGWTWVIWLPVFSLMGSMLNGQPLRKRQTVLMVALAVIGQAANQAANKWLLQQTYVVNVVGPFLLGLLSIIAARMSHGRQTALTLMLPGVLVSIPGGIAAAGGLAMAEGSSASIATSALAIGGRMISVCTGISLGLILAAAVGYFTNLHKKRTAIFAF